MLVNIFFSACLFCIFHMDRLLEVVNPNTTEPVCTMYARQRRSARRRVADATSLLLTLAYGGANDMPELADGSSRRHEDHLGHGPGSSGGSPLATRLDHLARRW